MKRTFLLFLVLLAAECMATAEIFWTTWNFGVSDGIYRSDRNGGNINQIITPDDLMPQDFSYYVGLPIDLAVDVANARIFLVETELDTIWETDMSGSSFNEVLAVDGEDPHQLEVDFENGFIYWVEDNGASAPARIGRCGLDGSNPIYLINNAGTTAGGIALDAQNGFLFWTETYATGQSASLAVWRCDLNGSNALAIVSTFAEGTYELGSIAVDPEAQKVYWIQDQSLIRRANYDGSNDETLYTDTGLGDRSQMTIDTATDELFWTSLENMSIGRATLDGSSNAPLIQGLSSSPLGIAVVPDENPKPELQIGSTSATTMTVTWTQPSVDWVLEYRTQLNSGSWFLVPSDDITMDGLSGTAVLDATLPQMFVRLRQTSQ